MSRQRNIYQLLTEAKATGKKLLVQLLDPDKLENFDQLLETVRHAEKNQVNLFFIGGSLITQIQDFDCVKALSEITEIPVVTFPSGAMQISPYADAILFLSLISGRNPELLIGQQVIAAPVIKKYNLETLATGYMLVDCGNCTTAHYISGTMPLPYDKPEIAATTALAGEMLGLKLMYLDGGSGAARPVSANMIRAVSKTVSCPLIVGGGIKDAATAQKIFEAGADAIVIGNGAEAFSPLLAEVSRCINRYGS